MIDEAHAQFTAQQITLFFVVVVVVRAQLIPQMTFAYSSNYRAVASKRPRCWGSSQEGLFNSALYAKWIFSLFCSFSFKFFSADCFFLAKNEMPTTALSLWHLLFDWNTCILPIQCTVYVHCTAKGYMVNLVLFDGRKTTTTKTARKNNEHWERDKKREYEQRREKMQRKCRFWRIAEKCFIRSALGTWIQAGITEWQGMCAMHMCTREREKERGPQVK